MQCACVYEGNGEEGGSTVWRGEEALCLLTVISTRAGRPAPERPYERLRNLQS
jgi:hypothetical protein